MDFFINGEELAALCGLQHIQQLAYLRGIRPYMDIKTGLVGIKRKISYQSISEQLYVEPHQGIKSQSFSKAQIRRALAGLERSGLIQIQSEHLQLILKCLLASQDYSAQKKAVTKPSQKDITTISAQPIEMNGFLDGKHLKPGRPNSSKADTPLNNNNFNYFFYLNNNFEKFWELYPSKKEKERAFEQFKSIQPSDELFQEMITALELQISFYQQQQNQGLWVPAWKYPANWLAHQCWKEQIETKIKQENLHAAYSRNNQSQLGIDECFTDCKSGFDSWFSSQTQYFEEYSECEYEQETTERKTY